jgi:broad specificity phosphatase PhoE
MAACVHLIRHGEVENPAGVVYGALPGFGLSARGREQARATAAYLESTLQGSTAIVTSPLDRARETAAILREQLGSAVPLTTDPALVEAGTLLEGLPRRFAPLSYLSRLLDRDTRAKIESPRRVLRRMVAAVRNAAETANHGDVILVSHQFPIWMATVGFEQRSLLAANAPWFFIRRPCTYASVTSLVLSPGEPEIRYWEPPERDA